ncbi:hypothetical protein ScPMuIL_013169 [Solemya velum]
MTTPLTNTFMEGGKELGFDNIDCNGGKEEGFCHAQFNTANGVRCSTFHGFLKPAMGRINLHVSTESVATKIIMQGRQAVGVEFIRDGRKHRVHTAKEVIISGGSVESPKLLMLSGIGPKKHLNSLAIPVVADLPVGENLQDHLVLGLAHCINQSISITLEKATSLSSMLQYQILGTGNMFQNLVSLQNIFGDEVIVVDNHFDIQCNFKCNISKTFFQVSEKYYHCSGEGFVNLVVLLHEKSRGTITLQSTDPFDPPLIGPNYLEHPDDTNTYIKGIRTHQKLMATSAFRKLGITKQEPLSACSDHVYDTDEY